MDVLRAQDRGVGAQAQDRPGERGKAKYWMCGERRCAAGAIPCRLSLLFSPSGPTRDQIGNCSFPMWTVGIGRRVIGEMVVVRCGGFVSVLACRGGAQTSTARARRVCTLQCATIRSIGYVVHLQHRYAAPHVFCAGAGLAKSPEDQPKWKLFREMFCTLLLKTRAIWRGGAWVT